MSKDDHLSISDFATAQLALLSQELAAEKATTSQLLESSSPKTLARAGLAILNLTLSNLRTGLGGKTVLELEPDSSISGPPISNSTSKSPSKDQGGQAFGQHDIRVGDLVHVAPQPKGGEKKREKIGLEAKGSDGVVVKVSGRGLQVALDRGEDNIEEGSGLRLWV